jgi:tetratricopeptide (TPR) repeat protein
VPRREYDQDDEGFGEASRYTAHLDRGWSLLDRGDYQRARNSAHQALKLRPEIPDAAMLMAAISLAESDPESSLEWYERAIEADADYVDAQLAAAQVLLYDLEQPQRALARAAHARELDEATHADLLDFGLLEIEALVSLGERADAAQRLASLSELWVIEDLLDAETEREELPQLLRQFAGAPPDFDAEDFEPLMGRVIQLALRVARLHLDLGAPEEALPWLEGLLRRFGDDADVWYLSNEAAYLAGEPVRAAHAALQVLQLDARVPAPDWSPQPAEIHAKVVDLLVNCADPDLRALAREPGFVVVVNEAPPFELVLEGVDPRTRALALAARNARESESAPTLTGLALYRRNLGRLARDRASLERELALAVFDELAVFFGYDDARREQLGLPPSDWNGGPLDPRTRARESEAPSVGARKEQAQETGGKKRASKKKSGKKKSSKKKSGKKSGTKKSANKKSGTKKSGAKKSANKKSAAKKSANKKSAAKKKATKKSAKKPAAKKPAAKKPAAKKPAAKKKSAKTATKKPSSAKKKPTTRKSAKKTKIEPKPGDPKPKPKPAAHKPSEDPLDE